MPNTSITIGIGNPSPGAIYQYEVGLCAVGNYPYTLITPEQTLTIDLEEESWYQPGLAYCYRVCEVNVSGEVIGCCCEGEGDSPYELIVEDRYVKKCCEEFYYTVTVESYFEITPGNTYTSGGECYVVGNTSVGESTDTIQLLDEADCENDTQCERCDYVLKSCNTDEVFANVILSPYQALNVGSNGDTYLYNNTFCFYFDYGTFDGQTLTVNTADINTNQGCDECQNPNVSYRMVNCQYPWQIGGNNASVNFIDGYIPTLGEDMVFGPYGTFSELPGCWRITEELNNYLPNTLALTQEDIISQNNCTDCINENFTQWDIINCNDPSDTLTIALLATIPNPTIGDSSTADSILINGDCYFFENGPGGSIDGSETMLIYDLTENPITSGGCSSCSGA